MSRSVFLKVAVGFITLFTLYSAGFFTYYVAHSYSRMTEKSFRTAENYRQIGRVLLRSDQGVTLSSILDAALKNSEIDYFYIRKNGEDQVFGSRAGVIDEVLFADGVEDGAIYEIANYRNFMIREGEYELTFGYKSAFSDYFAHFLRYERDTLLKDILLVSLLVLGLVFYSFRDLRLLVSRVRSRGMPRTDLRIARSSETLTLIQGFKGYQESVSTLQQENSLLKGQVLPALQNELMSGRPTPYEFSCTLARTDINNFTTLFSTQDRAQFMGVINEFFVELTHVVSRYKGFVHEFVGDEVIFYFKDDDHENSSAIAMSALRDINEIAEAMNQRTLADHGYSFRIKSSLSWGTLRFGPLVNGYALAGTPLIETVRMLSHVHEKSENVILFDGGIWDSVSFLCVGDPMGVVMLKGLPHARNLYTYRAHVPLIHHLRQGGTGQMRRATFYRSDREICEALDYVREGFSSEPRRLSRVEVLELLGALKTFKLTKPSPEVRASYVALLEKLRLSVEDSDDDALFALPSLISTATSLFSLGDLKGRLRGQLLACLSSTHHRVVANALDVFTDLDPDGSEDVFDRLLSHPNNRVMANALIRVGKRSGSEKAARELRKLLKQPSAYHKASALYALGEIARHSRDVDMIAFSADSALDHLFSEARKLIQHGNAMVRRHAITVLLKAGRADELRQMMESSGRLPIEIFNEIRAAIARHQKADGQLEPYAFQVVESDKRAVS